MAFITSYEKLTEKQKRLLDEAERAMNSNPYNPYSNFSVGAAILAGDGIMITGANVENVSYGEVVCAEKAAVLRANAMGYRTFESLAVISKGKDFDTKTVNGPCGSCRQVLYEFSEVGGKDIEIILSTTKKEKILISSVNYPVPSDGASCFADGLTSSPLRTRSGLPSPQA